MKVGVLSFGVNVWHQPKWLQYPHLDLLPLELEGRLAWREWVRLLLVGPALDSVLVGVDLLAEAGDGNLQIGQ